MSESRTTPFCCSRILPQHPFHKYKHYPRAYTCLFDFLHLITSLPEGYLLPTTPSKHPQERDFIVRLCKGHTNPLLGPNQWGTARYLVPAPEVAGGLIEMVNHENGLRYLTMVRELTKEKEETGVETEVNPEWGGFKHLEDVWMTVLCPVHRDAVWFLQFWIKGPKDNEELEEVVKRVRDRRNKEPGFVEDPFSRRFYEVVGIPSWGTYLEGESSRRHYLNEDEQKRSGFGGMGGDDVGRWRDQTNPMEQRRRFQEQRRAMIGFPPGLGPPPGLRRPPTIPPGLAPPRFLRQQQLFGNTRPDGAVSSPTSWALNHGVEQPGRGGVLLPLHNVGPRDMPVVQQPEASEDAGENMIGEPQPQATRQAFQGTALQWEDPALRLPFTSQPPGVAPPQEIGFGANHTPQLHSPQPSRSFDLADMWQSPSSIQHSR